MKLRRRLAFHFTYQLIAFSIFMFLFLTTLLFVLTKHLANEDIKRNVHSGVLDSITTETTTENGRVLLADYWKTLLQEQDMWLQVIDMEGTVIFSTNTPDDVPKTYSVSRLLEVKDDRRVGKYTTAWQMDLAYEEPLLFLLGRVDDRSDRLRDWFKRYQKDGMPDPEQRETLEADVGGTGGYLHVINEDGAILQSIGKDPTQKENYHPLEIMAMQEQPGTYATYVNVYRDKASGKTWVYHTPQENVVGKQPIMNELIRIVISAGLGVLVISVAVSVWHGYRYSRPLLLFTGWFERMRSGAYEEVLTPKDRKRVFRKKGKIRMRYKLYKEVIQSFYQMAEQLAETERERKRLERNREEWMSGISHDLRTPLSSIQGYGYMLELINDFSLIFQLKNAVRPQDVASLDLSELVRRCVLKYVNDATLEHVAFQYEGREDSVMLEGSAKWLHRLMDNLISNAVKHNPPGITVTVGVEKRTDGAVIIVRDNGVGMDEETKKNLFERYYRGTNTEESNDGSGLGMSIAKAIVDAHHGRVKIESEEGKGTCIKVFLPWELENPKQEGTLQKT